MRKRANSLPDLTKLADDERDDSNHSDSGATTKAKRKALTPNVTSNTSFERGERDNSVFQGGTKRQMNFLSVARNAEAKELTHADMKVEENDESFFELLQTFAKLDLPETETDEKEQCPLCPAILPIGDFATHMYECIKKLDQEEKKYQEDKDAALAKELARHQGLAEDQSLYQFSAPEEGSACPQGAACRRYDLNHFQLFTHPEVACPICGETFAVYEIDAHVGLCVDSRSANSAPSEFSGSAFTQSREPTAFGGDDGDEDGKNIYDKPFSFDSSSSSSSSSFSSSFSSGNGFTVTRGDSTSSNLSRTDSEGIGSQDSNVPHNQIGPSVAELKAPESPMGPGTDDSANPLSRAQMKAMANMVVEQKNKASSQQDVSLVQLLDTFKTLGFTKANLSKAL